MAAHDGMMKRQPKHPDKSHKPHHPMGKHMIDKGVRGADSGRGLMAPMMKRKPHRDKHKV